MRTSEPGHPTRSGLGNSLSRQRPGASRMRLSSAVEYPFAFMFALRSQLTPNLYLSSELEHDGHASRAAPTNSSSAVAELRCFRCLVGNNTQSLYGSGFTIGHPTSLVSIAVLLRNPAGHSVAMAVNCTGMYSWAVLTRTQSVIIPCRNDGRLQRISRQWRLTIDRG